MLAMLSAGWCRPAVGNRRIEVECRAGGSVAGCQVTSLCEASVESHCPTVHAYRVCVGRRSVLCVLCPPCGV